MKPPDAVSDPSPGALPDVLAVLRWAVLNGAVFSPGARGGVSLSSPFPPPPGIAAALRRAAHQLGPVLATLGIESPPLAQLAAWWLFELDAMDEDRRELSEERAAVREYEAGFPRAVAELVALADVLTILDAGVGRDTEPRHAAIVEAA